MKLKPLATLATVAATLAGTVSAQAQNLFEADYFSGNIYEFTLGGAKSTFASGLVNPIGLAFDSVGDLFVADFSGLGVGGYITKITPGGIQSIYASVVYPVGMAFNSTGDLFVSDIYTQSILEIMPGGVERTFASSLDEPLGLAFNSAGNLFVASGDDGTIYEFTPSGTKSTFASGLSLPWGLAFDSAGNLFVANNDAGSITEITPGGAQSTFASGLDPYGLAFDSAGNLFVANAPYDITKITPGGTPSTFASGLNGSTALAFQLVPEPSALKLLALGVPALLVRRHNRKD